MDLGDLRIAMELKAERYKLELSAHHCYTLLAETEDNLIKIHLGDYAISTDSAITLRYQKFLKETLKHLERKMKEISAKIAEI